MTDHVHLGAVTEFYDTHPINEQQILDKLRQDGFDPNDISEDILQNYDQDHYGGTEANDALAALAAINNSCHVLDVCSGVGGPSRYLAHNYGCQVTGIDLTESRIATATRLTALAGLEHLVTYTCANALDLPLPDRSIDVVISQEAFCHIPDKDRLVSECTRVLRPGGRVAFSDVLTTDTTRNSTRRQLQQQLTFTDLVSQQTYRQMFEQNGCRVEFQDLATEWRGVLADRLAMYRSLKQQTVDRYGDEHFQKWDDAYRFFVGLYETGELGGGRFLATRSDRNTGPQS